MTTDPFDNPNFDATTEGSVTPSEPQGNADTDYGKLSEGEYIKKYGVYAHIQREAQAVKLRTEEQARLDKELRERMERKSEEKELGLVLISHPQQGEVMYYEDAKPDRTTIESTGPAPRPSESEDVFRRYEPYIALAALGSYVIDPKAEPLARKGKGVTHHTFNTYFRDAVAAYFRYGYSSVKIHPGFVSTCIKLEELNTGCVRITNTKRSRKFSPAEVASIKPYLRSEGVIEEDANGNKTIKQYDYTFYMKLLNIDR